MKADKTNNYGYSIHLQPLANKLRKNMTKAEACLWKYALKARKMKGYRFRRQRPVFNYIADFMCIELKLVIEVDGWTHSFFDDVYEKDDKKDRKLKEAGFRVVRIKDEAVLNDIDLVILHIEDVIEEIEKSDPDSTP